MTVKKESMETPIYYCIYHTILYIHTTSGHASNGSVYGILQDLLPDLDQDFSELLVGVVICTNA